LLSQPILSDLNLPYEDSPPVFLVPDRAMAWGQIFTTQAVYLNNGTGPQEFPALSDMRSAWGDIDGDGDYDLAIMGTQPLGTSHEALRKRP
jgi:hypothetical protein